MWSAFFFSRYNALTAPLSMRDPLQGLGTRPCALRPRHSGNKASEEHQLRSDETNKNCARTTNRMHAMHSPRKVKPILSSHKKGTAPEKTSKHLSDLTRKGPLLKKQTVVSSSQERDCSLNRQRPQTKLSQQVTKCEWISGTLSQHVACLCDSRFLSQGVLYHPKRGQAVL